MIDLNNWRNFIPELSQKEVEIPHFDRASLRENRQKILSGSISVAEIFIEDFMQKSLNV